MSGSRKRVSNLFVIPPPIIVNIFQRANENEGYLDDDSIEIIKKFHSDLATFDKSKQQLYFRHALVQYRQYFNSRYEMTYDDLMKDLLENVNFSPELLNEILQQDSADAQRMREQKEDQALQDFYVARSSDMPRSLA